MGESLVLMDICTFTLHFGMSELLHWSLKQVWKCELSVLFSLFWNNVKEQAWNEHAVRLGTLFRNTTQ